MIDLKKCSLGDNRIPSIAIGFNDSSNEKDIKALEYLDVAEIRVDLFEGEISPESVTKALKRFHALDIPTVLTFRPEREGGKWTGNDEKRVGIVSDCYKYADIVDIEASSLSGADCSKEFCKLANEILDSKVKLLISYHNFETTPPLDVIDRKIEAAQACLSREADIVKIACQTNSQSDLVTLTKKLADNIGKNLIVIGMGEYGLLSRLSFPAYGSLITFSYASGMVTAPGQIHYNDMVKSLRELYPAYNQHIISKYNILEAI